MNNKTYWEDAPVQDEKDRVIEDNFTWFGFFSITFFCLLVATFFIDMKVLERVIAICGLSTFLFGSVIMTYRNHRNLKND